MFWHRVKIKNKTESPKINVREEPSYNKLGQTLSPEKRNGPTVKKKKNRDQLLSWKLGHTHVS